MSMPPCTTAFFDVTTTVAFVQTSADGRRISTFRVYPKVMKLMEELTSNNVRLGFLFQLSGISEEEALNVMRAKLPDFGDRVVVPTRPIPAEYFDRAGTLARAGEGCGGARLLFVSTDAFALVTARTAGFRTVMDPRLALEELHRPQTLRYLRIRVPEDRIGEQWVSELREQPLVPLHGTTEPVGNAPVIYAIASTRTAAALDELGFWVDRLGAPNAPRTTTLHLVRNDPRPARGFLKPQGNAKRRFAGGRVASRVLASTHEGRLVAVPNNISIPPLHDGRIHELAPSLTLLETERRVARRDTPLVQAAATTPLCNGELEILDQHITPKFMKDAVAKYAAMGNETTGTEFGSRHVEHPGNRLAVDALVAELGTLESAGITVERHCFPSRFGELTNVVATLPASDTGMAKEGIVVVSAHLDSIVEGDEAYRPSKDPAPGADDDASGMAAVLATASAFAELASMGRRHREVRFILFNAEEMDKSGSMSYAKAQAALGAEAAAVFHLDMIGYDKKGVALFEVHAGSAFPDVPDAKAAKARSEEQARLIEHLRPLVGTLPETELFLEQNQPGVNRSDHAQFHARGYPACWVTQDFFPEHANTNDRNPAYHTKEDTDIAEVFAAEIARLVGAAAWIAATR